VLLPLSLDLAIVTVAALMMAAVYGGAVVGPRVTAVPSFALLVKMRLPATALLRTAATGPLTVAALAHCDRAHCDRANQVLSPTVTAAWVGGGAVKVEYGVAEWGTLVILPT
jgi:hypothetical protein